MPLLPTVPRAGVLVRMLLLVPICTAFSDLRRRLPGRGANKRDAYVQFSLSTSLIRLETVSKIDIIKPYLSGQDHICQRKIRKLTKSDTSGLQVVSLARPAELQEFKNDFLYFACLSERRIITLIGE